MVTYSFDPGEDGEPYSATVRLTGRRIGVRGMPNSGDTFVHEEALEGVVPGSGPVTVSSWVYGLRPGAWTVAAELIRRPIGLGGRLPPPTRHRAAAEPLRPAVWSWRRWAVATGPTLPIRTRWALLAPLARSPGVLPGSFTVLGVFGVIAAITVQSAILAGAGVEVGRSLAVTLLAVVAGLIGAKAWSRALHPGEPIIGPGWAVDGFLVIAPIVAVGGLLALNLPIGLFLDATAPGLFLAVAIGRVGCFLTGCCAGRCTRHPWGLWSSDRRIGARRIPTQLIESATGLIIAVMAAALVLSDTIPMPGAVFVAAVAVYLGARHLLLRLRAEPRRYLWRRSTAVAS